MPFNSSDLKMLTKDLVILATAYSGGYLIGEIIRKVLDNEKYIQELRKRDVIHALEICEKNESELKK